MSNPKPSQASVAVYRLSGGGAEKVVMRLARLLEERKQLSRIYTGSAPKIDTLGAMQVAALNAENAFGAVIPFQRLVRTDDARSFLLTANYAALAPALRIVRPRARIVVRIAGILSSEMKALRCVSRIRYWTVMALACAFADCIVVQGKEMRADVGTLYPWAIRKILLISNLIEDDLWTHKVVSSPIDGPYIFCAATFRPVKAFDTLLKAFAHSPARRARKLVIAGVERSNPELCQLMAENGLSESEVVALGFVDRPYDLIANADLCVLASRYEGFSNFLLEAAAFGKLIVATACPGGNRELFGLYRNAILVGVDDVEALAQAIAAKRNDIPRQQARSHLSCFESSKVMKEYLGALFP